MLHCVTVQVAFVLSTIQALYKSYLRRKKGSEHMLRSSLKRTLTLLMIVGLSLSMLAFLPSNMEVARAATSTQHHSLSVNPNSCSTTLSISPTSLTAYTYTTVTLNVTVHCPPGFMYIYLDWRDGTNADVGICGNYNGDGCYDGTVISYSHQYSKAGKYIAKAYNPNNTSIAAWATCNIQN